MREHLRSLIDQARQEADSRTNGPDAANATTVNERLGTDAVRLARLAAAVHMARAVVRHSHWTQRHTGAETQSGAENVLNCLNVTEVSESSERPVKNLSPSSSSLCVSTPLWFSSEGQERER